MSPKPKTVILSAVLALTLAAATSTAGGATPARWIVFTAIPSEGLPQTAQVFRIRTSGGGFRQITTGSRDALDPSFAPNGKRVVFGRLSTGIFVMNLDGSGLHRLTRGRDDRYPVFSPDGRRIAFVHNRRLHVMRADGTGRRYLWRAPGPAGRPSWTPDGKSIAIPSGDQYNDFLFTVAARTGRIERRLALESELEGYLTGATLSPDGRLVAFIGRRPEPPNCPQNECEVFALYLKHASGGASRHLIDDGGYVGWSSDSRTLVYPYREALRLQPLQGGAAKTIAIEADYAAPGRPSLQPR
jgi:Tol biopolymer transport system component